MQNHIVAIFVINLLHILLYYQHINERTLLSDGMFAPRVVKRLSMPTIWLYTQEATLGNVHTLAANVQKNSAPAPTFQHT